VRFATDGHRETGITLHILQVHNRYQPGGEDVAVGAEAALLRTAGHRVSTYAVANPDGWAAAAIADTYQTAARRRNTDEIVAANSVFLKQIKQLREEQRDLEMDLDGVSIEDRDPLIEARLQSLSGEITALQTRTAELAANGAVFGSGIQAREKALPPEEPASPQPVRDAAVLAGIGFGLASAVAYWRQGRSRRVETRVDAAAMLDVPLLGEIPKFSRSSSLSGGELVLGGEASEAYEFVLSSIKFALADIEASSILVTTASSGDGKTVTALHVATASARGSRRVTLVDTRCILRGRDRVVTFDRDSLDRPRTSSDHRTETTRGIHAHRSTSRRVEACDESPPEA
jgi:hypothetical protein